MKKYDVLMAVERLTISLDADLAEAIRVAAEADAENVSSWIAEAARHRLSTRGLGTVIKEWERKHGAFTKGELAVADALLHG